MYGATAAKCAIGMIPMTTNQACCNLMVDENLADYRFIYYALTNSNLSNSLDTIQLTPPDWCAVFGVGSPLFLLPHRLALSCIAALPSRHPLVQSPHTLAHTHTLTLTHSLTPSTHTIPYSFALSFFALLPSCPFALSSCSPLASLSSRLSLCYIPCYWRRLPCCSPFCPPPYIYKYRYASPFLKKAHYFENFLIKCLDDKK